MTVSGDDAGLVTAAVAGRLRRSRICGGPAAASWRPSGPLGRVSDLNVADTAPVGRRLEPIWLDSVAVTPDRVTATRPWAGLVICR